MRPAVLVAILILVARADGLAAEHGASMREAIHSAEATTETSERARALASIAKTSPRSADDVSALHEALKGLEARSTTIDMDAVKVEVESLHQALSKATDRSVHSRVAELLGAEGADLPSGYFGPAASASASEKVRDGIRMTRILALIEAAGAGKNETSLPALRAISDKGGVAGELANRAIGAIGKPEDLDRFIAKIKHDPNVHLSLAPFGTMIVPRLMKEIDDPGVPEAEKNALIARLDHATGPGAASVYMPLLHHPNPRVAKIAARAVAMSGGAGSSATTQMFSDKDRNVRFSALASLEHGDWSPAMMAPVIDLLKNDKDEGVREQAAYVLGQKKVVAAQDALQAALQDHSKRVRQAAQAALDRLSGKEQQEVDREVQEILKRNGKR